MRKKRLTPQVTFTFFVIISVIICLIGVFLRPVMEKGIYKLASSDVQNRFYIEHTITSEGEEKPFDVQDSEAFKKPFSVATSFCVMSGMIALFECAAIKAFFKKELSLCYISQVLLLIKIALVFVGIFTTVYLMNATPGSKAFLYNERESEIKKYLYGMVINSEKFVSIMRYVVAVSGAFLLPLEYCEKVEKQKKEIAEKERINNELIQRMYEISYNVSKENKIQMEEIAKKEAISVAKRAIRTEIPKMIESFTAKKEKEKKYKKRAERIN